MKRHCAYCFKELDSLVPWKCQHCGEYFCANHRLPENHNCPFFLKKNKSMGNWKKHQRKFQHQKVTNRIDKKPSEPEKPIQVKNFNKHYFKYKQWFYKKRYPYSRLRKEEFLIQIGVVIGLSFIFGMVYSNLTTLNDILLIFIKLGSFLELILLIVIFVYLYKLLKNLRYGIRGLSNGYKLLSVFIFIMFCFTLYQNPSVFVGPISEFQYDTLNPFEIDVNFSDYENTDNFYNDDFFDEPVDTFVEISEIESSILEKTNNERQELSLPSLTYDSSLSAIAREHSQDMADNGFFSHTNLEGEDPTDRAKRNGYNTEKIMPDGSIMIGIGENIGKMPTGNVLGVGWVSKEADSIATAQVQSWMDSPGHRQNILNSDYDKIGIGVAYDGTYYFCTQNFQ